MENIESNRKACVFVSKEFARLFPNLDMLFRTGPEDEDGDIIFDCKSVVDIGNYLDIFALDQWGGCGSVNIWIPTRYVLAVLREPSDKKQMGFCRSQQDDIVQDQAGHSS